MPRSQDGVVAVKSREVSPGDVDRVLDAARAIALPVDRQVLHVLPQEFIVDDQDGIKDPIGMSGVRLEAEVHIITGAVTSAKNICRSIQRAGLKVHDLVLEPLASSHAVLGPDERDLGVVLLDLGGGTTDVAVFFEGSIRHTAIIPFGGANVTNDIAIGLRTPIDKAEQIKIQHGCALAALVSPEARVMVSGVGGRADRISPGVEAPGTPGRPPAVALSREADAPGRVARADERLCPRAPSAVGAHLLPAERRAEQHGS